MIKPDGFEYWYLAAWNKSILINAFQASKSFGSSAHGAGRAMSRHGALKDFRGNDIVNPRFTISDIRGRKINALVEHQHKGYSFKIEEPAGIYFLHIQNSETSETIMLIKD